MIIEFEIVRDHRSDKDQKDVSRYLNFHGLMSSVAVSSALAKARAPYDVRKVTNMMDRLRDYVAQPGPLAFMVYQAGSPKYWYPARFINEYLKFLGLPMIKIDETKFGKLEFSFIEELRRARRMRISIAQIREELS